VQILDEGNDPKLRVTLKIRWIRSFWGLHVP